MSGKDGKERRRGPVPLAELVGRVVDPVIAKRGFAGADLIAAWPAIVGQAYADFTQPERILWPRTTDVAAPAAGVLFLKVDGPRAIFLSTSCRRSGNGVNAFLGYAAIGQIQDRPRTGPDPDATGKTPVRSAHCRRRSRPRESDRRGVGYEIRGRALDRLGRGVLADRNKRT